MRKFVSLLAFLRVGQERLQKFPMFLTHLCVLGIQQPGKDGYIVLRTLT